MFVNETSNTWNAKAYKIPELNNQGTELGDKLEFYCDELQNCEGKFN